MAHALKAHVLPEPTVYAVDDDPIVRILLAALFEGANIPVETFSSAEEFLEVYTPDNPGVLLLDIVMPGMSGLELQKVLAVYGNNTPIIFLTGAAEVSMVIDALKSGASDFIEKPVQPTMVLDCVKKAMGVDLQSRYDRLQKSQVEQRMMLLTPREQEVMGWLVKGKSNKSIARILGISGRTVEVHRSKVVDKMHAHSMIDLATMLMKVES
ncbi:MAG: response regulator transcription factor [Proteobacteria bacterium]|nr:response regulator transcription factor [Pseudomonadota bacterium]